MQNKTIGLISLSLALGVVQLGCKTEAPKPAAAPAAQAGADAKAAPAAQAGADAKAAAPAVKPAANPGPEVGKACATTKDCSGNKLATVCGKDGDLSGFAFCTSDCAVNFTAKEQCGPEGACVYVGEGKGRCVPNAQAEALAKPLPPVVEVVNPCCLPKAVNDQGVGKQCKAAADCGGEGAGTAKTCPMTIREELPNWCTHLCDFGDDAACGPNAFCWWRPSKDRGMVGSCAPNACKKSENPPACPATK